ncbi:MAG TPA: Hsp20/alpha crystallin family protein [Candidatus Nanoarchaeia archaeon]|nr:Hsp20/alpha crystallin family protein [Candidatus Nanoarchaeia archaeon]
MDWEKEIRNLQKEISSVVGKLNDNVDEFWKKNIAGTKKPSTDITHSSKDVMINFHMHGVDRKKVFLVVDDDKVTLEAERKIKSKSRKSQSTYVERLFREITLPAGLNIERARHYWDGNMLTVIIPKKRLS